MTILFLTMVKINSFAERGIYTDLLRKFYQEGHQVYAVCPLERREQKKTYLQIENEGSILHVKTLNLQKTNVIEKGLGTIAIEYQFLTAIKKHLSNVKFDVVIYSTPPITFAKVIHYIKRRDDTYAYLLLKDIFPQNAVDMKMLKKNGILHQFFLKKERKLYALSDTIGCMSEANKAFVLQHNSFLDEAKVEINPNSIEPISLEATVKEKTSIREKYHLPIDKKIFVYGGNLGKPQGIDFLLETIVATNNDKVFFLIVGTGTEFDRMQNWFMDKKPHNALLLAGLPKQDYDLLLQACDVGLLFLHRDFTIPNFPSRLLSYLEMKIPILAATDVATDIGKVIEANGCGYWVISGDLETMLNRIDIMVADTDSLGVMKEKAWQLLQKEYLVSRSYDLIHEKLRKTKLN